VENKLSQLKPILLWEIAAGLMVSTVGGLVAGLVAVRANAYFAQGLSNTALYSFRLVLNRWEAMGLAATGVVAVLTAVSLLSSRRSRTAAILIAVPFGLLVAYLVGYELNRFDYKAFWLAPRRLLGIPLRAALFEPKVVLSNIGVLTVSVLAGWGFYRILLLGFRRLGRLGVTVRSGIKPEWVLIAVVVILAGFEASTAILRSRNRPSGPNVLLISLDTLRRDHLGCYGYRRDVSPNIDALTMTSVVYDDAITQAGSTLSSHKSVMTSVYPPMLSVPGDQRLNRRRMTVSEMLLNRGYRTVAFANGLGWVTPLFRFDQGFDKYVVPSRRIVPKLATAEEITGLALEWLSKHSRDRFFMFLHYGDIHSDFGSLPYSAPEPYGSRFVPPGSERFDRSAEPIRGSAYLSAINWGRYHPSAEEIEYIKALYDGGICYTDHYIGELVRGLSEEGLLDRTMVVIFADHGEEFGEHGRMLHGWVYCEVARVPLIVRYPGGRMGGSRVGGLVELLDVAPTILAAVGAKPGPEMCGRDLASLEVGEGKPAAFTVGEDAYALRTDRWMYLMNIEDGHREMYRIAEDPGERIDVTGVYPEDQKSLEAKLLGWIEVVEAGILTGRSGEPIKMDRKTRELLKSLGYLQTGE
jgi:arylsulfatase A-like enzyme